MYLGKRVVVFVVKVLVLFALIVMLLHLVACVTVGVTPLRDEEVRQPVAPEHVAVYRAADQINGPYREVALLDAAGESTTTSDARMYAEMRKKAGALGANGILLDASTDANAGPRMAPMGVGLPSVRRAKAIAIVVDSEPITRERSQ